MKQLLLITILAAAALAQTASDLLQKGIYTQETLGDLDGAIRIYRTLLDAAKENRAYAAQAQYRLAVCLAAKGDSTAASQAFQTVIDSYPEQKDLVEKAREHVSPGLKLLPAPWTDGESLEFALKTKQGFSSGMMVYSAEAAPGDSRRLLLQTRMYAVIFQNANHAIVDRDTFLPVSSQTTMPMVNTRFNAEYSAREVNITRSDGSAPAVVPLAGPVYDNEEFLYLVRRLPLSAGYKIKLPVMAAMGSAVSPQPIEVIGEEDIQVTAGKFHCYKVSMGGAQTFWVSTSASRPVVKLEMAGFVQLELEAIRSAGANNFTSFSDPESGLSFSAAGHWLTQRAPELGAKAQRKYWSFSVYDREMAGVSNITISRREPLPIDLKAEAESGADGAAQARDYKVRSGSWQPRQIGGLPAISYVADTANMIDPKQKLVEYVTFIRGANTAIRVECQVNADRLDDFRKRFDPLLESLRVGTPQ